MTAPTPGSPEWGRIVTASKVPAIIGVSPWESPRSMWHKMRGDVTDDRTESPVMLRGNILEPAVLAWWLHQHPEAVDAGRQRYHQVDKWCGATTDLDAYMLSGESTSDVLDTLVIVEAKTAARADEWGDTGTDLIPVHYLTQVYWQLAMCPEAVRAYVAVLLGPGLEFREYVVERDEDIQADLVARCRAFYDSLTGDEPPDLDDHTATVDVLRRLHPDIDDETVDIPAHTARDWLTAKLAVDAAQAAERKAKATVLDLMGQARHATSNGRRVARRQNGRHGVSLVPITTALPHLTETL